MPPNARTTSRAASALLDAALVGLLATILAAVVVARLVPLMGNPTLVVAGGSMAPAIGVGSAIILDRVDPGELAVGDVVSLQESPWQTAFTHRITRIVERDGARWLETKGDANAAVDPSITAASGVIGRVALAVPLLGFVIALMTQPSGVVSVLALAAALLVARTLVSPIPNASRSAGVESPDRTRPDEARPDVFAANDVIADDGGADRGATASARRSSRGGPRSSRKRAAGASPGGQGTARPRAIRAIPVG